MTTQGQVNILVEGPDGAGKDSLVIPEIAAWAKRYYGRGSTVTQVPVPGFTPAGQQLRYIVKNIHTSLSAIAQMSLFLTDMRLTLDALREMYTPGATGVNIFSRWAFSTYAYQCVANKVPLTTLISAMKYMLGAKIARYEDRMLRNYEKQVLDSDISYAEYTGVMDCYALETLFHTPAFDIVFILYADLIVLLPRQHKRGDTTKDRFEANLRTQRLTALAYLRLAESFIENPRLKDLEIELGANTTYVKVRKTEGTKQHKGIIFVLVDVTANKRKLRSELRKVLAVLPKLWE